MRVRPVLAVAVLAAVLASLWAGVPWAQLFHWAIGAQREFQDAMAVALRAARSGDLAAVAALCSATALYGVVHAMGPGHGKVLLGGAALASGATLRRMTVLTVASSLAQAGTAIALVGGLAVLLGLGAHRMGEVADEWLAPASYLAIGAIGAVLVVRGLGMLRARRDESHHDHGSACGCGHAHGPSADEAAALTGWRDGAALVASIAIRPCTGALFVLAIALRFDMFWTGALAVIAMGLGTAAFNLVVAWGGVAARRGALIGVTGRDEVRLASAGVHVVGGAVIVGLSLLWLSRFAV